MKDSNNYPDWVEEQFGDNIPEWAEERWSDDNDERGGTEHEDNYYKAELPQELQIAFSCYERYEMQSAIHRYVDSLSILNKADQLPAEMFLLARVLCLRDSDCETSFDSLLHICESRPEMDDCCSKNTGAFFNNIRNDGKQHLGTTIYDAFCALPYKQRQKIQGRLAVALLYDALYKQGGLKNIKAEEMRVLGNYELSRMEKIYTEFDLEKAPIPIFNMGPMPIELLEPLATTFYEEHKKPCIIATEIAPHFSAILYDPQYEVMKDVSRIAEELALYKIQENCALRFKAEPNAWKQFGREVLGQ